MRMIRQLINAREYRLLFQNILHLFFFQGTNYLLPLITIPYIVRIIGPEKFGILSFAEVINYYFVLISDYGFNITGTQKLSVERENLQDRNRIFSVIFSVKIILLVLCLSILLLFDRVVGLGSDSRVFYLYFLMVPGNILLSYWFYLGMEKMHYLNFPNLLSKILYAILIFMFLRTDDQYFMVPLFYGLSLIGGGFFSIFLVFRKFQYSWTTPTLNEIWDYLQKGWSIFISTFAINLYRKSNVFILGLFASKEAVGFYSAGEKIIIALQSLYLPNHSGVLSVYIQEEERIGKGSPAGHKESVDFAGNFYGSDGNFDHSFCHANNRPGTGRVIFSINHRHSNRNPGDFSFCDKLYSWDYLYDEL